MRLFSGTSNQPLAKKVARRLGVGLGKMEIVRFGNSECRVRVEEDVRGKTCLILQSTSAPSDEHLMEMFFMVDSLKRSAALRVVAVIPYFGYARQNQQHRLGECISAHVVSKFIETIGVDELIIVDLHEEQISGFFEIPVSHLSGLPVLAKAIKNYIVKQHVRGDYVIVSPDQGGIERARRFLEVFKEPSGTHFSGSAAPRFRGGFLSTKTSKVKEDKSGLDLLALRNGSSRTLSSYEEIVVVEKKRDLEKMHVSEAVQVVGDVRDKVAIIVDDIITSGGTIVNAAEALVEAGAKKIFVAATHADFIEETVEKLQNSPVEKMFVTDTINLPKRQVFPKLEIISVSSLLAKTIEKLERTIER